MLLLLANCTITNELVQFELIGNQQVYMRAYALGRIDSIQYAFHLLHF